MGKSLIKFQTDISFASCASAVGKKEHDGPFGDCFDFYSEDDSFGRKTWEQSEGESQHTALNLAINKGNFSEDEIDAVFSGDLINQCTPSAQGLLGFDFPQIGLYGACSTCALGIGMAGLAIESGHYRRCAAVTSSHNLSAERQFRYPVEYASLRTPTSQWTVTGAGAFILESGKGSAYLREFLPGRSTDKGITDANNMGAAMAPSAFDTIMRYFDESGKSPDDFDKIITGDLGCEGYEILLEQFACANVDMTDTLTDCGLVIYDRKTQDVCAGGSGCGCSAVMLASVFLSQIRSGKIKDILFVGTGALLSPLSVAQGDSIPGISHLVRISGERK